MRMRNEKFGREDYKGDRILFWELRKFNEEFGWERDYLNRCLLRKGKKRKRFFEVWNMVIDKNKRN